MFFFSWWLIQWRLINDSYQFPKINCFHETFPNEIPDHLTTSKTSFMPLKCSSFYYLRHFIVLLGKPPRSLSPSRVIRNAINFDWSVEPLLDLISKGGLKRHQEQKSHSPSFSFSFPSFLFCLFSFESSSPVAHFSGFSPLIISHQTHHLLSAPRISSSKGLRYN